MVYSSEDFKLVIFYFDLPFNMHRAINSIFWDHLLLKLYVF